MQDLDACTARLILGHLSEQNNHPEIVRMVATQSLEQRGLATRLVIAEQTQAVGSISLLTCGQSMIPRYTRPEMGRIWSDQNKFQQWLEVELAASEALAELGVVPAEAARAAARARRLRRARAFSKSKEK